MKAPSLALACCSLAVTACWVQFPEARLTRDGKPDLRMDHNGPLPEVRQPERGATDRGRDAGAEVGARDHRLDASATDLRKDQQFACTPDAFVSCVNSDKDMVKCNSTGTGQVTVSCGPPGKCDSSLHRCNTCNPSDPPFCSGSDLKSCSSDGLYVITTCPNGCQSGKCCPPGGCQ